MDCKKQPEQLLPLSRDAVGVFSRLGYFLNWRRNGIELDSIRIRQKSLWLDNGKAELFRLYSVFKVRAKSRVSFNPSQGLFGRSSTVLWKFFRKGKVTH